MSTEAIEKVIVDPLAERHAKAKQAGAKAAIVVDVDGVDKVLYCKEPHRKIAGLWQANYEKDQIEANFNLVKGSVISELSDMDIMKDTSNAVYIAISSQAGVVADLVEVKKSYSLIL